MNEMNEKQEIQNKIYYDTKSGFFVEINFSKKKNLVVMKTYGNEDMGYTPKKNLFLTQPQEIEQEIEKMELVHIGVLPKKEERIFLQKHKHFLEKFLKGEWKVKKHNIETTDEEIAKYDGVWTFEQMKKHGQYTDEKREENYGEYTVSYEVRKKSDGKEIIFGDKKVIDEEGNNYKLYEYRNGDMVIFKKNQKIKIN
jgi:hypothetical protein